MGGMFSGIEIDWHKIVSLLGTFAVIGSILGWLPYVAALAAFIWYVIQIWESRTIQYWWGTRQLIRRTRRIAKLKAKEKVIAAKLLALQTVLIAHKEAKTLVAGAVVAAERLKTEEEIRLMENLPSKSLPPLK